MLVFFLNYCLFMFFLLLESLVFSLLLVVPLMQQPLSLGFAVLSLSFFLSVLVAGSFFSWYGFILFLIYVGGLLVLFSYVIVLTPNFAFSLWGCLILFFFFFFLFLTLEISFLNEGDFFSGVGEGFEGSFFFFADTGVVFVSLAFILFLALIVVVKICYFFWGSLRPFVV